LLECPLHGGKLDVRDGSHVALPIRKPARTYPVRVVDGGIEIDLGRE
jgi:anthranilate 1,2-dioxygenase ferredoxin subunit